MNLKVVGNEVVLEARGSCMWDWNEMEQHFVMRCGLQEFKDACQRDLGLYDLSNMSVGTYAIPETSNYLNLDDEDAVAEFVREYMQKKTEAARVLAAASQRTGCSRK